MKKILILGFVFSFLIAKSQNDTTITLDQLQVPSSPAFNILGISPNSIERPKNPTDFAFSLGNATSGFSTIPKDYAIEFAPFWVFGKKQATFQDFKSNKPGKNILQTATISAATTNATSQIDSSEFRKVAVAFKFSIFRGELRDEFNKWNDSVTSYLNKTTVISGQIFSDLFTRDTNMINFRDSLKIAAGRDKKKWMDLITTRQNELKKLADKIAQDSTKDSIEQLKELASKTDFKRYGFKLDFALGTAMDYPDTTFQTCYVSKFSSWLTMGWENPDFNLLFLGRFSENINHKFRNDSNVIVNNINLGEFDYGFRVYKDFNEKFTISLECLRRLSIFNANKLSINNITKPESSNRYVVSFNYKVGKNQNLSFVYGKDFDNTYLKQGNLVAALNFMLGFGSNRPFSGASK